MNTTFAALTATAVTTLLTAGTMASVTPATANPTPKSDYDFVSMFKYGDHFDAKYLRVSAGKVAITKDKDDRSVTISFKTKKTDANANLTYNFHAPAGMKVFDHDVSYHVTGSAVPTGDSGHYTVFSQSSTKHSTDIRITAGVDAIGKGSMTIDSVKVELVPSDFVVDGAAR